MSADKYPSIFSRQMEAIVYLSSDKPAEAIGGNLAWEARLHIEL